ncbi:MAG: NAD(P)H-dependent oxidoreductase subunit E [candidate division Zixibacteria bacterium]|nr:NAD(P)H-dependent oxidoreductase subunit E [candidate division Zixibacteria bacterium]
MILTPESVTRIKDAAALYPQAKSAILPAITIAYRQVGHLNPDLYGEIAGILDIPAVEVAEAASFYTMFPKEPVGKYLIQVCHNISCALLGAEGLLSYLQDKLDIEVGETTSDNLFTLVRVECLGSCATAPMMQINHDYYENLSRAEVDRIIEKLTAEAQSGGTL